MLTIPLATTVFIHVGMYSIFLAVYDIYISLTSWAKPRDGKPSLAKKKNTLQVAPFGDHLSCSAC